MVSPPMVKVVPGAWKVMSVGSHRSIVAAGKWGRERRMPRSLSPRGGTILQPSPAWRETITSFKGKFKFSTMTKKKVTKKKKTDHRVIHQFHRPYDGALTGPLKKPVDLWITQMMT
jgi:hypothetical protein